MGWMARSFILTLSSTFPKVGFVPRKIRIQYPGAMYHLMSRGGRRENIFLEDVDRHDFLKTLAEPCQKTVSVTPGTSI